MLSADDLAMMRATQVEALPGSVVIQRAVNTPDGMGGFTEAWTAVGTVAGRIYPMVRRGQAEIVAGGQVISESAWYATLPVGTDVAASDRLLYNNRTWEVARVNNDQMWQTAVRCELVSFNEEQRV